MDLIRPLNWKRSEFSVLYSVVRDEESSVFDNM